MNWYHCRRRPEISLLASGVLGEEEKIELECHLAGCQECRSYYGEIKALTMPLAGWPLPPLAWPSVCASKLKRAFLAATPFLPEVVNDLPTLGPFIRLILFLDIIF